MFSQRNGLYLFTGFGVDVSASGFYLLLLAFIVFWSPSAGGFATRAPVVLDGLVFAAAVTVSLLVHEYGHAALCKHYSLSPSILLHGFGGLCFHREASSDADDALILLAGPGAGLVFSGLCVGVWSGATGLVENRWLLEFVGDLVWINIVWSLANLLLPIWPLDGGRLFHLLLRRLTTGNRARELALKISTATVVLAGAAAVMSLGSLFLGLLAFFLILHNVQMLQSGHPLVQRPAPTSEAPSEHESELVREAREALEEGDWQEAYRLGHQLRGSGGRKTNLPDDLLDDIWEILAVSATELGKFDEAGSYLDRAPKTDRVRRARETFESSKGEDDAA